VASCAGSKAYDRLVATRRARPRAATPRTTRAGLPAGCATGAAPRGCAPLGLPVAAGVPHHQPARKASMRPALGRGSLLSSYRTPPRRRVWPPAPHSGRLRAGCWGRVQHNFLDPRPQGRIRAGRGIRYVRPWSAGTIGCHELTPNQRFKKRAPAARQPPCTFTLAATPSRGARGAGAPRRNEHLASKQRNFFSEKRLNARSAGLFGAFRTRAPHPMCCQKR